MYFKLKEVVIKATTQKDYSHELQEVVNFYGDDFNPSELEAQLELFGQMNIDVSGE